MAGIQGNSTIGIVANIVQEIGQLLGAEGQGGAQAPQQQQQQQDQIGGNAQLNKTLGKILEQLGELLESGQLDGDGNGNDGDGNGNVGNNNGTGRNNPMNDPFGYLFGGKNDPHSGANGDGVDPWSKAPKSAPTGPSFDQNNDVIVKNLTGSDWGDPHFNTNLQIAGSDQGSNTVDFGTKTGDSMRSHGDLFHTGDVAGGLQVSTAVTHDSNWGGNGTTTVNQSASVQVGGDMITLNRDGSNSIKEANGTTASLVDGQSMTLANGETVTDKKGAITVHGDDQYGGDGSVDVTLSAVQTDGTAKGSYVNVAVNAKDVVAGGDLVSFGESGKQGL